MPKQIDLLKKAKYRKLRLQGMGKGKALEAVGYAKTTAYHCQNDLTLVKLGESEIMRGFHMQDVTPEKILREIDEAQKIARELKDTSSMLKAAELKGRYLAMWTDKQHIEHKDITDNDKLLLDGLNKPRFELPVILPSEAKSQE